MSAHWGWPQWVTIGLYCFMLLFALARDGEPRTGTHSLSEAMLAVGLSVFMLWSGGFFA